MQRLTNYDEFKPFIPIISHWYNMGKVRFLPISVFVKRLQLDHFYGLTLGEIPIGIIWWSTNKDKSNVTLEIICVNKNFLGLGFGTMLMDYMYLLNSNAKLYKLKVKTDNEDARDFYSELGYHQEEWNSDMVTMIKKIENNNL